MQIPSETVEPRSEGEFTGPDRRVVRARSDQPFSESLGGRRTDRRDIQEILHCLQGATAFFSLDACGAYHAVRFKPGSRACTAFISPFGMFQYICMPFGLANAGSVYSSMLDIAMKKVERDFCTSYLDDILTYPILFFKIILIHYKYRITLLKVADYYLLNREIKASKSAAAFCLFVNFFFFFLFVKSSDCYSGSGSC